MNDTIFCLSSCSTCTRIIKELQPGNNFRFQDIKFDKINENQLDEMASLAGSFEALFSRKAMKFKSLDLHLQKLTEKDYKKLILEEYTFLKRPVIVYGKHIFIGNSKSVTEKAKSILKR